MTTYEVTAWCSVPHYTTFEVEATSIDEALEKAKIQARDEVGEPCDGLKANWDEFEVSSQGDDAASVRYLEPSLSAAIAAPTLLAALCRFEESWRKWADDIRCYPEVAAATGMFDLYEQARNAIAEASNTTGEK
jgi:hypothetical protein